MATDMHAELEQVTAERDGLIMERKRPAPALAPTNPGEALAAILSDAERLKGIDVDKLERLFDLGRSMAADAARREFAEAFNRLQAVMVPVHRAATNPHTGSRYAKAEAIERMLDPLLNAAGFSRSTSMADCPLADHVRIVLTLRHIGGHSETHQFDAPIDNVGVKGSPTKTRLHGAASSWTYAERYLLTKVCGVQLTDDDDGNAGGGVGPGAERITEDQLTDLDALIQERAIGPNGLAKLLAWLGVEKLADLPASQLKKATTAIEGRR